MTSSSVAALSSTVAAVDRLLDSAANSAVDPSVVACLQIMAQRIEDLEARTEQVLSGKGVQEHPQETSSGAAFDAVASCRELALSSSVKTAWGEQQVGTAALKLKRQETLQVARTNTREQAMLLSHNCSFHMWAFIQAREEDCHPIRAVWLLFLSTLVVFIQVMLLVFILMETSLARCSNNGDCRLGEWCTHQARGTCTDCYRAQEWLDRGNYDSANCGVFNASWVERGVKHCMNSDIYPERCDFVANSLNMASGSTTIVLLVVVTIVYATAVSDFDESADEAHVFLHHDDGLEVRLVFFQLTMMLRRYVMPIALTGVLAGLSLINPFTSSNIIMNGLGVTFITDFDNVVAQLCLSADDRAFAAATFELMMDEAGGESLDTDICMKSWFFRRAFAAIMAVSSVTMVYLAEPLMSVFGRGEPSSGSGQGKPQCNNFGNMLYSCPTVAVWLICALRSFHGIAEACKLMRKEGMSCGCLFQFLQCLTMPFMPALMIFICCATYWCFML